MPETATMPSRPPRLAIPLLWATCVASALPLAAREEPFPRTPATEPDAALATFRLRDGFRLELLAAEPLVTDPVAAAYDEDGRLYVVEMSDYPYTDPAHDRPFADNVLDPPIGRVRLLVDRDGDGRFDEGQLFAEKLSWPTGVAPWKGGVFVAATPDVWYFKDTDGDGRADVRERVLTGFRKFNVQAVMNNLIWGLDHRVYGAASGNGGRVVAAERPDAPAVDLLRKDFRFDPRTGALEAISGGARFGNTFDDRGNRFLCDIRNPAEHVVLPAEYLGRNPLLAVPRVLHDAAEAGDTIRVHRISPPEPWRELRARRWAAIGKAYPRSELIGAGVLTSSSGVTVYRGDAYPPGYRGNILLGEVANNLVLRFAVEPDGVTFRARRAEPEGVEFLASTDTWSRVVNFVNAPDGTLHLLDMYRETIEHPWSIPDDIKARLDLRSGTDRGRIYRLAPPSFRPRPTPRLGSATTSELVALLEHPNAWHRETAHRLLFERQDGAAVEPLRRLLREGREPTGRLHALWSLSGLDALDEDDLRVALEDADDGVLEHAIRLAEPRLCGSAALREKVVDLAGRERGPRVRFQLAFTLGEVEGPAARAGLATIARRDADDPWVRAAVLSSAYREPMGLFRGLLIQGAADGPGGAELLRALAFQVGAGEPRRSVEALGCLAAMADRDRARSLAVALAEGVARSGEDLFRLVEGDDGEARAFLEGVVEGSKRRLDHAGASPEAVVESIAVLSLRPYAEASEAIRPRLAPSEPEAVLRAAVRALASYGEAEAAGLLLGEYRAYTPAVRRAVLEAVLGRPTWHGALLDAVESGVVAAGEVPAARAALLRESGDPATRERARRLLEVATPGLRAEALARYREALTLAPDPARGRAVFERECLTCHRLGEQGQAVGPNLASVARRGPDEILLHVLDPNREVAPDYLEYVVELADGRVATGLVESESATSLTLRRAGGESETILRRDVAALASSGKSLMPEGLEEKVGPREMADLIAFLLEIQR